MYRAPGFDQFRWMELEIDKAQKKLDGLIAEAQRLPDTEPSKAKRITRLNAMKREASTAFASLNKQVHYWSRETIPTMYRTGWLVGATQLQAGMDFTLPHKEALDLISKDAYRDVATNLQQVASSFDLKASQQILYEGMDPGQILAIQDKSRTAVAQALLTGEADPRKVARDLSDELWGDGVKIIDGGGNHWNMDTYTRMLVRTKTANAYNAGSLTKYVEEGVSRVTVFDGTEHDQACADANGQTWTIKYAAEHPIEHPNCERAFAPKPGGGEVSRGDEVAEEAAAARAAESGKLSSSKGLFVAQLIRSFTAEADLSPTAVASHFGVFGVEYATGVPLVFVDDFIGGFVSQTLRQIDDLVEGTVDPALFSGSLTKQLPAVVELIKSKTPDVMINRIAKSVADAGKLSFPLGGHPLASATVEVIKNTAMKALQDSGLVTPAGRWLPQITNNELRRAIGIIGSPRIEANRFGMITAEMLQQWAKGNDKEIRQAFTDAAFAVDHLQSVRRAAQTLADGTAQDALLVRSDLDEKIRLTRQAIFETVFDIGDLQATNKLLAVEAIPRAAFTNADRKLRQEGLEKMLEELEELRALADQKVVERVRIAAANFGANPATIEATARRLEFDLKRKGTIDLDAFRARRTGGPPTLPTGTQATGGRKLLAPVRGTPPASATPDMASAEEIAEVAQKLEAELANTLSDPFDQDMWDEFGTFFARVLDRYAEDPDDPLVKEVISYVNRKSVVTDLNIHLAGGVPPLPIYTTQPVRPIEFIALLAVHMSKFSVRNGEMRYGAKVIGAQSEEFIALREVMNGISDHLFRRTSGWVQEVSSGADPTLLLKFVDDAADPQEAIGHAWDLLRSRVAQAAQSEQHLSALIGSAPPNGGTVIGVLKKIYGSNNVKSLGKSGANGTVFKITDENGVTFVVKRLLDSGSGRVEYGILSYGISRWVDEFLMGGRASIHTTAIRLDGDMHYLGIMPYFEGRVWNDVAWDADVPPSGLRKLRLFDMLGQEADGHGNNYLFNPTTGVVYSIDNEMSGGVFSVMRGSDPIADTLGIKNVNFPTVATDRRATRLWQSGDDLPELADGVPVRLIELTDDEVEAMADQLGTSVLSTITDGTVMFDRGPVPLIVTRDTRSPNGVRMFVPAGRTGTLLSEMPFEVPVQLSAHNLFLSKEEARKLRQLVDVADDSPIRAEIRQVVQEAVDTMTDATRARAIVDNPRVVNAGGTVDDLVDELTNSQIEHLSARAVRLLDGGVAQENAMTMRTGANGVIARVGDPIVAVRPDGSPVAGLITGLFVNSQGQTVIQYAPNLGVGHKVGDLTGQIGRVTTQTLDDLYNDLDELSMLQNLGAGDRISVNSDISDILTSTAPGPMDVPAYGNPRFATIPSVDEFGIQIGETVEHITIHAPDRLDDGIRVIDADGNDAFTSWGQIFDSDALQRVIDEELALLPPEYRPREIVLHFDQLVTSDGKAAFGFVEADTRTMHLSYSAALSSLETASVPSTGKLAYRVAHLDEVPINFDAFRELVRHELGHTVEVGLEERLRAKITAEVWRNFADEFGELPATRAELAAEIIYNELIPDGFDVDQFDDIVDAFVASRTELIEDIVNTNVSLLLDDVFRTSILQAEDMPVWVSRAYEGIRRNDPDAYHEFFAEIWMRLVDSSVPKVADELGVDASLLERIIGRELPDLPTGMLGWDDESDVFQAWLIAALDDRATALIPRARSADRKLWKLNKPIGIDLQKDIVDNITRDIAIYGEPGSGATIQIMTGKVPEGDVIAVARGPNELVLDYVAPDDLLKTIETYINKANNRFFLEQEQWSLGLWVDADGNMTLDVSMVFDDPIEAALFGFQEGQKAGFRFGDLAEEHYLDTYKDFNEWFTARGEAVLAERGIELTDELYDAITQRVGAAFMESSSPARRRELRGVGGKHLPVGEEAVGDPKLVAKLRDAGERRYIDEETGEYIVISPDTMRRNFTEVLERAEIEYGFVDRSLPNDEWIAARNLRVKTGIGVSDDKLDEFIDEVRDAYDILDRMGVSAPEGVTFTLTEDSRLAQLAGVVRGPTPNGASRGSITAISDHWSDLPGLGRNRTETIIHELAHHLDPDDTLGRKLWDLGFRPEEISPYASEGYGEMFAEAFLAVVTGRASDDLIEAMIGFSFDTKEVFTSTGLVEMDRGAALRILHRFYEDWHAKYKELSIELEVPMWKIVGAGAILSPGMLAEINRDAAAFMIRTMKENPSIRNRDVTKFRKFLLESAESIRTQTLKKKGYIPDRTQETLDLLAKLAKELKGSELSDMSDEMAAYALAWLARESGIMVNEQYRMSLTGRYGMPQVIRAVEVLRGSRTLNEGLGNTKTRSFYNNIMDPKNLAQVGDVTVDFHMANAAAMALGMQDIKHADPKANGMEAGLRPMIGDMVRQLFDEGWGDRVHADSPAELQEVIWAIWRASTDWEKDKLWFGERPHVVLNPDWKQPNAQELEALIQRLGLR